MLPVLGRPMLVHLIERLRRARRIDHIIIATTEMPADLILQDLAEREGAGCFRGSEDDVMARVLAAARAFGVETIVDVTSDCPLVDPDVTDAVIEHFLERGLDYASNVLRRSYPRGLDVQVYRTEALARAASLTDDRADHEHVTLFLYEHPELFSLGNVEAAPGTELPSQRLTLDTPADFFVIRAVFESLYPKDPAFGYPAILAFLKNHPEIAALNAGIEQKMARAYDHTAKARAALGL